MQIDFDDTRTSFYGVAFRLAWDNLQKQCVEISGLIELYQGRPQIVIGNQNQVARCGN
ncbi:MAG: hypothetical protein WCF84_18155 [Anaerolineae bacterium]